MEKEIVTTNHSIRWVTDIIQRNHSIINAEKLTKQGWFKDTKAWVLRCKSCS